MKRKMIAFFIILLASITSILWSSSSDVVASSDDLILAGTVEARSVVVTSEVAGRVAQIDVQEGDEVVENDILVRIDDTLLQSQISRTEAVLAQARAGLAGLQSRPRPEVLANAQAEVAQAEAAANGAKRAWFNALVVRENPQELNAEIDQARARLRQAEVVVALAEIAQRKAEVMRDGPHGGDDQGKTEQAMHAALAEGAIAGMASAQAARDGAEAVLNQLLAIRNDPVDLDAAVHKAYGLYEQAAAQVVIAQARLDTVQAGARPEEIVLAQAIVIQAEAALQTLMVQQAKMNLRAPLSAIVTERVVNAGEVVLPGTRLLTLADLSQVDLTVYVPENRLNAVALGQRVPVRVDAYPERTFEGEVVYISPKAEFTPRTVQTPEDRARTVFAVKLRLDNADHALRPGMTGEAAF